MYTERHKYKYTERFLRDYKEMDNGTLNLHYIMWGFISCQWRYKLPEDFIIKYKDYLHFWELSKRKNYSKEILECEELKDYWRYHILIEHTVLLTDNILDHFLNRAEMIWKDNNIVRGINKRASLHRLEKLMADKHPIIDWDWISERDDLTKEFIEKYLANFDLDTLLEYSNLKKLYKKDKDFISKVEMLNELRGSL